MLHFLSFKVCHYTGRLTKRTDIEKLTTPSGVTCFSILIPEVSSRYKSVCSNQRDKFLFKSEKIFCFSSDVSTVKVELWSADVIFTYSPHILLYGFTFLWSYGWLT